MASFENQEQEQQMQGDANNSDGIGMIPVEMTAEGDVNLECRDCGYAFLFTVGEQEFYRAKDFEGPPTRCKPCRAQKKATRDSQKHDGGNFGGQMNYLMMDAYGNPVNMYPYQQRPPSNLRTKPCHAFQRGECTYGADCRYYHDDGSQGPPGQYLQQHPMGGFPGGFPGGMYMGDPNMGGGMFMAPGGQQGQGQQPGGGGGSNYSPRSGGGGGHRGHKSRNPCFAFQRGECTYGDSCRYLHVDASSMTDANGNPIVVHPHLPRGYCHAFARGECKYGETCKFRHEIPANFQQPSKPSPNVS
mmetsp:Transcript_9353/g.17445  ORF Transcript_9353/g.17445 Transcript_9353/m.17445 type:complete len:301 (-) Transcript_9353:429-1331(-)